MSDLLHIDGKTYIPAGSAAELYGFTTAELQALSAGGRIRATKVGKKIYVELASLHNYLNPPPAPDVPEEESEPEPAPILAPVPISGDTISRHEEVSHPSPIRPQVNNPAPKQNAVLPFFAYALLTLVFIVVFGGSGYIAVSRYGPGTVDASYVAAVGITGEPSFSERFHNFVRNLLGIADPVPVLDWPEIREKPRVAPRPAAAAPAPSSTGSTGSQQASTPVQTTSAPRVVERVVERVIVERPAPKLSSGITEAYINSLLNQLDNKLSSQISAVAAVGSENSTTIVNNYNAVGGALRIDQLDKITLNNSTISGGSISGASVSATSLTVTGTGTSTFSGGTQTTALNITSTTASSTFANGINLTAGCVSVNGTCLGTGSGTVGTGSATNLPFYAAGGTTLTATSTLSLSLAGNFGIGTTSPFRKLSVTDTVAAAQFALAYDTTRVSQFQTDASGDLVLDPSGNEVLLSDDNLMVCTSGCGTSPSGTGSILAENKLGVGTTTPAYKVSIETQDSSTNFLQIASSTAQSLLVFNANGNLGIGSSTPFHKLSLGSGGAIVTTEFGLTDGATIAVDWSRGNQQYVTLGGNRTITFSNYLGGQVLRLFVCQDSTGSRTVTWPAVVLWESGTAPTLTTTANKCDIANFVASVATSSALKIFGAAVLAF